MLARDIRPVIFYSNPNIDPREEYERRRSECERYAALCGVAMVEDAYDHAAWLREAAQGREDAPERGARCLACFFSPSYQKKPKTASFTKAAICGIIKKKCFT